MDNPLQITLEEQMPLRDRVYEKLRDAILDGTLKPGTKLVETSLAEQMGVSRTPVREALQRLASEGLAEITPRKGVIVQGLSVEEVEEVFLIREVLEGLAGFLAAKRISEAQIDVLEIILKKSEVALAEGRISDFISLNSDFHKAIVEAGHSSRLKQLLDVVLTQIGRYRRLSMADPERRRRSVPEHWMILEAIKARDPAAAERALRQHSRHAKEVVLKASRTDSTNSG